MFPNEPVGLLAPPPLASITVFVIADTSFSCLCMNSGDSTSWTCATDWNQHGKSVCIAPYSAFTANFKPFQNSFWPSRRFHSCMFCCVSFCVLFYSSPQFVQQKLLKADFHGAIITGGSLNLNLSTSWSLKCLRLETYKSKRATCYACKANIQ